jgi:hypothetical protein
MVTICIRLATHMILDKNAAESFSSQMHHLRTACNLHEVSTSREQSSSYGGRMTRTSVEGSVPSESHAFLVPFNDIHCYRKLWEV